MIPVDNLLYKIDQRLNKLASNEHQEIPLEDKILALNEAQLKLVKQKFTGISTFSKMGFGAFKKRYQDIEILLVDFNENAATGATFLFEDPNEDWIDSSIYSLNYVLDTGRLQEDQIQTRAPAGTTIADPAGGQLRHFGSMVGCPRHRHLPVRFSETDLPV